jgi:hypothetical protein
LQDFFALPRYPFTAAAVAHAPEEGGIYGLFQSGELIYLGAASGRPGEGIRDFLGRHLGGAHGECTRSAMQYTWEISIYWATREMEVLAEFRKRHRGRPRCQLDAA